MRDVVETKISLQIFGTLFASRLNMLVIELEKSKKIRICEKEVFNIFFLAKRTVGKETSFKSIWKTLFNFTIIWLSELVDSCVVCKVSSWPRVKYFKVCESLLVKSISYTNVIQHLNKLFKDIRNCVLTRSLTLNDVTLYTVFF